MKQGSSLPVASFGFPVASFLMWSLLGTSAVFAQRDLRTIPPPDPEIERKSFLVADGFEVNLFASDPALAKPIQMNFDPQGRLWVATSQTYPHIKPGQKADDKILILQDTNGDGRSDRTTVFARGLLIPTGVAPGDGGAYVANSTELLHFADTNGDGKADRKRVVLSGFGTEDTHHILHTLRWGPDGCLYMNQSIYIHSHIETPYGVQRLNGGGIWRFRPETGQLQIFARGWINPWGHQFDDFGQSFVTDGAGGEGINFVVPGAAYPTAVGVPRILHGLNPGSPKYCGLEIVGGRHLPGDWQGNLLTNDFRGNRVCRFVLAEDGAGFVSRQKDDLIRSRHVAFRPVDIAMGPDGAIYIADWYNPIIQHGEVDFRDPRRDHVHGRIWRVTYKGRPLVPRPKLVGVPVRQLLEALKAPEQWSRREARRRLKELGPELVLPELKKWTAALNRDDPLFERHRLEALWIYQALRFPQRELLKSLLSARDPRVRAAAVRVLGDWLRDVRMRGLEGFAPPANRAVAAARKRFFQNEAPLLLQRIVNDGHPRVRLEGVRALAERPSYASAHTALQILHHPLDPFLDYALWLTLRDLQPQWQPLIEGGEKNFGGHVKALIFAARSTGSAGVLRPLIRLLQTKQLPEAQRAEILAVIARQGSARELRNVYEAVLQKKQDDKTRALLLESLARAAEQRGIRPAGELSGVISFFRSPHLPLRGAAIQCAGLWRLETARAPLKTVALDEGEPLPVRNAAAIALGRLKGPESRRVLLQLTQENQPVALRRTAIVVLCDLDLPLAAQRAVPFLSQLKPGESPAAVVSAFLQRRGGAAALTKALKGHTLPTDAALLALRTVSSSGRKQPVLEKALRTAGRVEVRRRTLSPAEIGRLVQDVQRKGDPLRGEAVFRRRDLNCLKCHSIAGAGGKAGPDLLSIGGSAQIDYLIESLLDPNKKVKENYHTLVVLTESGKVYTGIKVRRTETELILRDAEDRELRVPLKSIELQRNGKSLMPAGLTDRLTRGEFVDLVRFLSELGQVGKLTVGRKRFVRTWRVLRDTPAARFRLRRTSYEIAATEDAAFTWEPAYSTVGGTLPLADVPGLRIRNRIVKGSRGVGFVRFFLRVTTPGKVGLRFSSPAGLSLWVGHSPHDVHEQTVLNLPAGLHRLTLGIDLGRRKLPLQIELIDVPGSKSVVEVVGGK